MIKELVKEERATVLDFLPNGYPFDTRPMHQKTPIVQALGREHFILLELVPKKGVFLEPNKEVYLGEGKRDEIHHIIGKIPMDKLTQTAKMQLEFAIKDLVEKTEERFVTFFNTAGPVSTRTHQIELIPGIGKKHMWEIIEKRQEQQFSSFADMQKRIHLMPDPKKAIIKRIIMEIGGEDKYKLFTR